MRDRPSDTCPNCGSKKDTYQSDESYTQYLCRYATDGDEEWDSEACEEIQGMLAAAARKGMNAAIYAQQEYGSRRSEYPADSSEREAYDRAYSEASDAFEHCWAALARYNALHKEAGGQ